MGLFSSVCSHVGLEVVGAREFSLANITFKGTHASVLAGVTPQLVRATEALSASFNLAGIRLLSSVLADVHLQVGQLHVSLGASWVEADKGLAALLMQLSFLCCEILDGRHHGWHHCGLEVGGWRGEERHLPIVQRSWKIVESHLWYRGVTTGWWKSVHVARHHGFFGRGWWRERPVVHAVCDNANLITVGVAGSEFRLYWRVLLRGSRWGVGKFIVGSGWAVVDGGVGRRRMDFLLHTKRHVRNRYAFFNNVTNWAVGRDCNGRKRNET